jgi:ferredoxin
MSDDLYRGLARTLDSIAPGFPASQSGVELRLLARLYTPEEAAIVAVMRLNCEPAGAIAKRAAVDPDAAHDILCAATNKGLVRARTEDGERTFALIPETSGLTGFSTPAAVRDDAKAAQLYVRWIQETRGGSLSDAPAARRVIPTEESISFSLAIHPYEQASGMLVKARSWGVLDCMCRRRTGLTGQGCSHPLENCLVFAPDEGAFNDDELIRAMSQEESLRILRQAAAEGFVHTTGNYRDHRFNICNCCPCSCSLLRGAVEFQRPTVIAQSDFRATVDQAACEGCGDCTERYHFAAVSVPDGFCVVDHARCVGCGQCTLACSIGALSLGRRPAGDTPSRPADAGEWVAEYAKRLGLSLPEYQ